MHSCALSIAYFSVTFIVPIRASVSTSQSATSSPCLMFRASASSADSVIGIGQNSLSSEGSW